MKNLKLEWMVVGFSALFMVFTLGFFLGRNSRSVSVNTSASVGTDAVTLETQRQTEFESTASVTVASEPINLNTASQDELESLPGIGPALAARILRYREENGPFQTTEELMNVSGIGEKKLEALQNLITVG